MARFTSPSASRAAFPKASDTVLFLAIGVDGRFLSCDTLQADPSESRNSASEPKFCSLGGMENLTPLAAMTAWKTCRSSTENPNSTVPGGFRSDEGCKARTVLPVANSLQPGDWDLRGNPSVSRKNCTASSMLDTNFIT